jgi:hypothetical protein
MSSSPDFIPQHPPLLDPQMPPPYRFDNVGMRIFMVPAKAVLLQNVCKHFFNDLAVREGLDFRINPITTITGDSFVYLQILNYPKITSKAAGQNNLGYVAQNEFLVSIPVVYENLYGLPLEVGMFTPFLFVDNDWSQIAGREVIGYPKVDADFDLDPDPAKIVGTKVRANALHDFAPGNRVRFEDVFEIADLSNTSSSMQAVNMSLTEATELQNYWPFGPVPELFGPSSDNRVDEDVYELMLASAGVKVTSYTLKQFRNAVDPTKACYQAILDNEMKVDGVSGGGVYTDLDLKLYRHDSLEIAARLGINAPGGVVSPTFGFWYQANLELEEVGALYESCHGEGGTVVDEKSPTETGCSTPGSHDCVRIAMDLCEMNMQMYCRFANVWIDALSRCARIGKR